MPIRKRLDCYHYEGSGDLGRPAGLGATVAVEAETGGSTVRLTVDTGCTVATPTARAWISLTPEAAMQLAEELAGAARFLTPTIVSFGYLPVAAREEQ